MRKVKKRARQFLCRAETSQDQLDERKTINSHWLKHANLMPVLNYLATKAEGLDWCQNSASFPLILLAWNAWQENSRCEDIHIWYALLETAQTWLKPGEKIRLTMCQRTSGIEALFKTVCPSVSPNEALIGSTTFELHTTDRTPLQPFTIGFHWGFG